MTYLYITIGLAILLPMFIKILREYETRSGLYIRPLYSGKRAGD